MRGHACQVEPFPVDETDPHQANTPERHQRNSAGRWCHRRCRWHCQGPWCQPHGCWPWRNTKSMTTWLMGQTFPPPTLASGTRTSLQRCRRRHRVDRRRLPCCGYCVETTMEVHHARHHRPGHTRPHSDYVRQISAHPSRRCASHTLTPTHVLYFSSWCLHVKDVLFGIFYHSCHMFRKIMNVSYYQKH